MTTEAASEIDTHAIALAVGQFLALAATAGVRFDLVDDRVVMRAINLRQRQWQPLRTLLDELGIAQIEAYLRGTTSEQRSTLGAVAAFEQQPRRVYG